MKIECRGYAGNLINLEATEEYEAGIGRGRLPHYTTQWYEISIRTDDGAKITLSAVSEREIRVME